MSRNNAAATKTEGQNSLRTDKILGTHSGLVFVILMCVVASTGCFTQDSDGLDDAPTVDEMPMSDDQGVTGPKFRKVSQSNVDFTQSASAFEFARSDGSPVDLEELAPNKPVVLVITRGATVPICPACSAQTARLINAYKSFSDLGAEVVVVYPQELEVGKDRDIDAFLTNVRTSLVDSKIKIPFPIVFDFGPTAVEALGLKDDLAKPSTFIFDGDHELVFAHVGEGPLDRPSVDSLLEVVRRIVPETETPTVSASALEPKEPGNG